MGYKWINRYVIVYVLLTNFGSMQKGWLIDLLIYKYRDFYIDLI